MKQKKQKRESVHPKEKDKKPLADGENSFKEKPFDFGGLPDRDLKKNLGCG